MELALPRRAAPRRGAACVLVALALLADSPGFAAAMRGVAPRRVVRLEQVGAFGATTALGPGSIVAISADGRLAAASEGNDVLRVWRPDGEARAEAVRWRGERVSALALDDTAAVVAAGSESGEVALWSASGLKPLRALKRHRGEVRALAFGDGGKRLLTGGEDGAVCVTDVANGKLVRRMAGPGGPVRSLRMLDDGRLAVASEQGLAVYDVRGRPQRALAHSGLRGAAFAASGLAAVLWDEEGRVARVDLAADPATATELLPGEQALAAWLSGDGAGMSLLRRADAAASGAGSHAVLERWRPGESLPTRVAAEALDVTGAMIVAEHAILGSASGARVWRIAQPAPAGADGPAGAVAAIAVAPDGQRLLSAARDGTARLWDVESARALARVTLSRVDVRAACFAPSGRAAAVADIAGRGRVLDPLDGRELAAFDGQRGLEHVAFAGEEPLLIASASYDRMVLRDVGAASEVGSSRFPRVATALAFVPDGRTALVALGPDLQVREVPGGKALWTAGDKDRWIVAAALSPDGARAATVSRPRLAEGAAQVALWDARSGRRLRSWSVSPVAGEVRLALGGDRIAMVGGESLVIYDAASGREVARREVGELGERGTAIAPLGEEFVVGTSFGRMLRFALHAVADEPAKAAARPAGRQ